jgi:hypothetical protein
MDLVVGFGECNWLLRPMQGLQRLGVDEVDLTLVLVVPPLTRASL